MNYPPAWVGYPDGFNWPMESGWQFSNRHLWPGVSPGVPATWVEINTPWIVNLPGGWDDSLLRGAVIQAFEGIEGEPIYAEFWHQDKLIMRRWRIRLVYDPIGVAALIAILAAIIAGVYLVASGHLNPEDWSPKGTAMGLAWILIGGALAIGLVSHWTREQELGKTMLKHYPGAKDVYKIAERMIPTPTQVVGQGIAVSREARAWAGKGTPEKKKKKKK